MLPSEALQREFLLQNVSQAPAPVQEKQTGVSGHAINLGGIGLLLPRGVINEILEKHSVCELPNTPSWFSGIISLRGNMIPVFNLIELLNPSASLEKRRLLTIAQGEESVAIWINELPVWKHFSEDERLSNSPPLPNVLREHVISTYSRDGQIWVDWDVSDFFAALSKDI